MEYSIIVRLRVPTVGQGLQGRQFAMGLSLGGPMSVTQNLIYILNHREQLGILYGACPGALGRGSEIQYGGV